MQKKSLSISALIDEKAKELGFSHWGLTPLQKPLSFAYYQSWIAEGLQGEMRYLKTHEVMKESPQKTFSPARNALVFAMPYFPHPQGPPPFQKLRTALYAQGKDYHFWLQQKLETLIQLLKEFEPERFFISMTDSRPLMERDLAYRAGLGWFGKNTCLIDRHHGSLFLIGEILTDIEFTKTAQAVSEDFCGKCQKCLEVCPTQALVSPQKMDARKCISYWTIESKQIPPLEMRTDIGDWFFGCDLCQTVCPWNQKLYKTQLETQPQRQLTDTEKNELVSELRWVLTTTHHQIQKKLAQTPLARAGAKGLKRNAIIVAANLQLHELKSEIQSLQEQPYWKELATWALHKINTHPQ